MTKPPRISLASFQATSSAGLAGLGESPYLRTASAAPCCCARRRSGGVEAATSSKDIAWIWKKLHGIKDVVPIEEKLKEMTLLLDSAVQTIRKIASELRPSILDDLGVVAALEWQSNEFQKRFRVPVDFRTSVAYLDLDAAVATGLFRLYQESLTNVARHAQASCVVATLDVSASHVILEITDDGKGFDTQKTEGRKTLGLLGMKERVLMMNGDLNIISKPGKGTRVVITVPLVEETLSQPQHQ